MLSTCGAQNQEEQGKQLSEASVWLPAIATIDEPGTPGVICKSIAITRGLPLEIRPSSMCINSACAALSPIFVNVGVFLYLPYVSNP